MKKKITKTNFQVINFKIIKEKPTKQLKKKTLQSVIFTFVCRYCFKLLLEMKKFAYEIQK
jgi:hypothetical protein